MEQRRRGVGRGGSPCREAGTAPGGGGDQRSEGELPAAAPTGLGFGCAFASPPPYSHLPQPPFASSNSYSNGFSARLRYRNR